MDWSQKKHRTTRICQITKQKYQKKIKSHAQQHLEQSCLPVTFSQRYGKSFTANFISGEIKKKISTTLGECSNHPAQLRYADRTTKNFMPQLARF